MILYEVIYLFTCMNRSLRSGTVHLTYFLARERTIHRSTYGHVDASSQR